MPLRDSHPPIEPPSIVPAPAPPRAPARRAIGASASLLSAVVPGLGQLAQGRWAMAALHAGTVAMYLGGAHAAGGGRAYWLALAWSFWSAIDAHWHRDGAQG